MIKIRRVYDPESPDEHYKVLIDRLWPRAISKENAGWNEWLKEIAPSNELRKWYNHDPEKWEQFNEMYKKELANKHDDLCKLKQLEIHYGTLTLLYSSKEERINNAVALKEILDILT
jgi:uncharacterized protein YeaO (DUF488 family)